MIAPTHGAALVAYNLSKTFEAYVSAVGTFGIAEIDGLTLREWAEKMKHLAEYLEEHQDGWTREDLLG